MPIQNQSKNKTIDCTLYVADRWWTRLIGWLGAQLSEKEPALYITPCSSIHTFGMKFPIDAVFIDKKGYAIHILQEFVPNRISKMTRRSAGVIEFRAGIVESHQICIGDRLVLHPDRRQKIDTIGLRRLFYWPANILLATIWSIFVYSSIINWSAGRGLPGLGLLIFNTVIFILFLKRQENERISGYFPDWLISIVVVGISFFLKPTLQTPDPMALTALIIQGAGILLMLNSLIRPGRGFGVVPAPHSIQKGGFYKWIRHPLYGSELVFYAGFLSGNVSIHNLLLSGGFLAGQIYRIYAEEKLLLEDTAYQFYVRKVKYRLIPGIF